MKKLFYILPIVFLLGVVLSQVSKNYHLNNINKVYYEDLSEYEAFIASQDCSIEYPGASTLCIKRKINDLKYIIDNQKCLELVRDYRTPHSESYNESCGHIDADNNAVNSGLDFCIEKYDRLKNECGIDYWNIY